MDRAGQLTRALAWCADRTCALPALFARVHLPQVGLRGQEVPEAARIEDPNRQPVRHVEQVAIAGYEDACAAGLVWVLLSRLRPDWRRAIHIVRPDTAVH